MSNQESIFVGQEQHYPDPCMVNEDPREQRQWQEASSEIYTDPGIRQMGGDKLRPQPPLRPHRRSLFWPIAIAVIVLLAFSSVSRGFFATEPRNAWHPGAQTFSITGRPTLIVSGLRGDVHIRGGEDESHVIVRTGEHHGFGGDENNTNVKTAQDGNTITVTMQGNSGFLSSREVDLDIFVPQATNIQQLDDSSGSIEINGISGQINAESGSGDIELRNASLSGQSTLHTGSGSIDFRGTLDRNGTYDFEAGSGSINVTLPEGNAFHLNASTNSGSVDNHEFGSNDVGNDPRAQLTLKTGSGSIEIHKGEFERE